MSTQKKSVFEVLSSINVNGHVEKKNGLTYLSWAWAWSEVKKAYPTATYKVLETKEDTDLGYMCHTEVTIEGETLAMWLPVMDGANKSMKRISYEYMTKYGVKTVEAATMFDINKTIMRCLVKNLAMFGLGIYIYAGEDVPESEQQAPQVPTTTSAKKSVSAKTPIADDTRPTLTKKHESWDKVTKYVADNKATEFTHLLQQLSRKYVITPAIQKELEAIKNA